MGTGRAGRLDTIAAIFSFPGFRSMLLNERYIGLMSGTSVDGVDAALADLRDGRVQTLGHVHLPFTPALRGALQALMHSGADEIERAGDASVALAEAYAEAVVQLLARTGHKASDVAAIGAHGQTVRHRPERRFTVQINQPALIAERTGIAVVADFRSRDVAAGGQGAPLVPAFHAAVFQADEPRAVVNIGGIANVTLLPGAGAAEPVRGFDTGPGNTLLDAWCERHTGQPYDHDGAWGAGGSVHEPLFAHLLDEAYFRQAAPKSTGRERFNMQWLDAKLAGLPGGAAIAPRDVQATLTALTARTIAAVLEQAEIGDCYVCGGGAANGALMAQLPNAQPTSVLGVDPMQVEALAFAWLARQCFHSEPGNVAAVTGASGQRILGAVYPA